jgi:hypothetical protein
MTRNAIETFNRSAYSINKHLGYFFSDRLGFRSLQARTGTLISGPYALQFLDRTHDPESSLDLYTHPGRAREVGLWLMAEGYVFQPDSDNEPQTFHDVDFDSWTPWIPPTNDIFDWSVNLEPESTLPGGVRDTYRFQRVRGGQKREIQIMAAVHTPMQCILEFHCSKSINGLQGFLLTPVAKACIMNFITYEGAYSLYPWTTFEARRNLALIDDSHLDIAKYAERGWRTVSSLLPNIATDFFVGVPRFSNDGSTWRVPLNTEGVQPPPPLSDASVICTKDPSAFNSWVISATNSGWSVSPQMGVLKSGILRYCYTCADIRLRDALKSRFAKEWDSQLERIRLLPDEEREAAWIWYVRVPLITTWGSIAQQLQVRCKNSRGFETLRL